MKKQIDKTNYELVWSDEFDYVGVPNPDKWKCDTGDHGWGNDEIQYYTENENAWVNGDKLVIELRKEASGRITSARLNTHGRGMWTYGIFEARAKIPKGLGTWPAIWMLGEDIGEVGWPLCGEIDIMEHVGFDEDVIVTSVHTKTYNHGINTEKNISVKFEGITDDFHVFSVEWLEDEIRFYVDDDLLFTFNPKDYGDEITEKEWPFHKPFFLLLNFAFGGHWGGKQGVDESLLPLHFEVDYVRVYQKS